MKSSWIKYAAGVAGILLIFGCKNHSKNTGSTPADPIFQTDPNLKSISSQINSNPDNAALYFERGNMLHRMRMDTLALNDYKAAAHLDSTKAEYFSAVGDLLFDHKDIAGSVQWIQKAIALDPKDKRSHLKIAKLFLYTGDYIKSIEESDKVLRQDVYNPEAYFLKGMAYKESGDTPRAISNFQTSVQSSPDYRESVIQLGLLYSAKKDPIALGYLDNAFKLDSTDVFPIFAKGVYYQDAKDDEKAKELYRECIARDSRYENAFFNMGYLLMQEDSMDKAWRQYDIVTKIDPSNASAYYDRGVCAEEMKKTDDAVADYKQAYLIDTTYKKAKAALVRMHAKI